MQTFLLLLWWPAEVEVYLRTPITGFYTQEFVYIGLEKEYYTNTNTLILLQKIDESEKMKVISPIGDPMYLENVICN